MSPKGKEAITNMTTIINNATESSRPSSRLRHARLLRSMADEIESYSDTRAVDELDEIGWSSVKRLHHAYAEAIEQIRTLCRLARMYEEHEITKEEFRRGWIDANNSWLAM